MCTEAPAFGGHFWSTANLQPEAEPELCLKTVIFTKTTWNFWKCSLPNLGGQ